MSVIKNSRRRKWHPVSASELAQMGVCERLVVFEHRYGKRISAEQRKAIQRGVTEHERFFRESIQTSATRGRCYIATLIFGEGHETMVLRLFRERILRPTPIGRWLIGMYYRTAPGLCIVLERYPWYQSVIRAMLKPIVLLLDHALRGSGGDYVG